MTYPLKPHDETNAENIASLVREFPFAHLFTSHGGKQHVTRLPFVLDSVDGSMKRLRAHMNAKNPQAENLDGADVLVAFSGPDSYVSPNWRRENNRGATWDYTSVHIWGRAAVQPEQAFFEQLIADLANAAETRHAGLSDRPNWSIADTEKGYVERLHPHLLSFEIEITETKAISKLHQDFAVEDAMSVVAHMEKSPDPQTRAVAAMIKTRNKDRCDDAAIRQPSS